MRANRTNPPAPRGRTLPAGGPGPAAGAERDGTGRDAMAAELREALERRLRDLGIATVTAEHPQVRQPHPQPPENPGINPCLPAGGAAGSGRDLALRVGF